MGILPNFYCFAIQKNLRLGGLLLLHGIAGHKNGDEPIKPIEPVRLHFKGEANRALEGPNPLRKPESLYRTEMAPLPLAPDNGGPRASEAALIMNGTRNH